MRVHFTKHLTDGVLKLKEEDYGHFKMQCKAKQMQFNLNSIIEFEDVETAVKAGDTNRVIDIIANMGGTVTYLLI